MNASRLFLLFVLPALCSSRAADSALPEPTQPPATNYAIECQMVTVPTKMVPALVAELNDESKVATAWARLLEGAGTGDVTLTGQLLGKGAERRPLKAESTEEMRYATDYDPPQVPSTATEPPTVEALKNWPHVGIRPRGFDTRLVGQTVSFEIGRTSDPKVVVCSYEVAHTRFEKFTKIDAGRLANGERLFVEQPQFSVMRDASEVTLALGRPKLVGVHKLPGDKGLYELFVLTATVAGGKAP